MTIEAVLELTGKYCNSRCVWCMNQYDVAKKIKAGFMSFKWFIKFVRINNGIKLRLYPYGHGEALINPDFVKISDYAIKKGININGIHTNFAMSNLTKRHFLALCKHDYIVINFGGGRKPTHFKNMGTDFYQVLSNIRKLNKYKKETNSDLKIRGKMVINKHNHGEIFLLSEILETRGITLETFPLYFGASDGSYIDKKIFMVNNLEFGTPSRDHWIESMDDITVIPKIDKCPGLIPTVRWDGAVNICCRARYHDGIVGNAFETPMKEIIKSKAYKEAVKKGLKREYIDYCKYCS